MSAGLGQFITEPEIKLPTMRTTKTQKFGETELIRKMNVRDMQYKLLQHENRVWMKRHGKVNVGINPQLRQALRSFFSSLDSDSSGAVSIEELYEPLLALGLVESKEQVQRLFKKVDSDNSGVIEFNEFMQILETEKHTGSVLREMVRILVDKAEHLPFKLRISNARRRMMLSAYDVDVKVKDKGQMVLKAFEAELSLGSERKSKVEKLVEKKKMGLQREMQGRHSRKMSQDLQTTPGVLHRPQKTHRLNLSFFY